MSIELTLILTFLIYMGILFVVALLTEKEIPMLSKLSAHPFVYTLALGIYCTTWTYYGSVGEATHHGILFLAIYIGPTLAILSWWYFLRKMVRIKNTYEVTSIADFISVRYNRSQGIAILVTLIALIGALPYMALQLKAAFDTFRTIITPIGYYEMTPISYIKEYSFLGIIILFTIIFGARRLNPRETHKGMVLSVAIQSIIQLLALLCAGIFVTYGIFNGFSDIFDKLASSHYASILKPQGAFYSNWFTYLIIAMSAINFLPRQFHIAVVENSNEKNISSAMWGFPIYMFLINLFVIPIAAAGLLKGLPIENADKFVLSLPLQYGHFWLALLIFIGGISAAVSMIMICAMTLSTMITNHMLVPFLLKIPFLSFLKRYLLQCRWIIIGIVISLGYGFEKIIAESYMLVSMGVISFVAVLQFAPAIIGGMCWKRAHKKAAILGLSSGFIVWFYTLLIPAFIKNGWLDAHLTTYGPFGIAFFNPQHLFGLSVLEPTSHAVFWSMFFNLGCYIFGSLLMRQTKYERQTASEFVDIMKGELVSQSISGANHSWVDFKKKKNLIYSIFNPYVSKEVTQKAIETSLLSLNLKPKNKMPILDFANFCRAIERQLASFIGSATAHNLIRKHHIFTPDESKDLSKIYADIISDLHISPEQLKEQINFYKEKEILITQHAKELGEKIEQLEKEIYRRKQTETALKESEKKYRSIVDNSIAILIYFSLDGTINLINDIGASEFGKTTNHFIGKSIYSLFLEEKLLIEKHVNQIIETQTGCEFEISIKQKSFFTSLQPVENEKSEIIAIQLLAIDITDRKSIEKERENLIEKLEAKNSELEQFTHTVSHDLKSPLITIRGFSKILSEDIDNNDLDGIHFNLEQITSAANKMQHLIDDLLKLSRVGKVVNPFENINLEKILNDVLYLLKGRIEQSQAEIKIIPPLPIIYVDKERIQQVLQNLIENAIKFTQHHQNPHITISSHSTRTEHIIHVKDRGVGINPKHHQRIFDIFQKLDQTSEGTGIGLSFIKKIIDVHGGRIWVEANKDEEGTCFSFSIPIPKQI